MLSVLNGERIKAIGSGAVLDACVAENVVRSQWCVVHVSKHAAYPIVCQIS